jgi:hypothetical protein
MFVGCKAQELYEGKVGAGSFRKISHRPDDHRPRKLEDDGAESGAPCCRDETAQQAQRFNRRVGKPPGAEQKLEAPVLCLACNGHLSMHDALGRFRSVKMRLWRKNASRSLEQENCFNLSECFVMMHENI